MAGAQVVAAHRAGNLEQARELDFSVQNWRIRPGSLPCASGNEHFRAAADRNIGRGSAYLHESLEAVSKVTRHSEGSSATEESTLSRARFFAALRSAQNDTGLELIRTAILAGGEVFARIRRLF